MISKFVYNNSKKETIILIHGLFANSGFWLKYLIFFKDYRLIIYNIDYNILLNKNNEISDFILNSYINDCEDNIVAVIAHSLGTVLADLVFGKGNSPIFYICPIAFASRIDSLNFVFYISDKININTNEIESTLSKADNWVNLLKVDLASNGEYLIPSRDSYFNYNTTMPNKFIFDGDHFNIEAAISSITVKYLNK